MFVIECGKIRLDEEEALQFFHDYFRGNYNEKKATKLIEKAMDKYYEVEEEIVKKLIREFGSLERAYEEYHHGDKERVLSILYEELDKIIEEIEEELNK